MSTPPKSDEFHRESTEDNVSWSDTASSDVHNAEVKELPRNFTDNEIKGLGELRRKVLEELGNDHQVTDFVLLRFLRARKFDVPAAVDQYVDMIHWRRANKVDKWSENPPIHLRKIVPESFHGFDKKGHPLYIVKSGLLNPVHVNRMSVQDFIDVHIWGNEYSFQRCAESSKKLGRNIDRFTNILDLEGLGMKHRKCLDHLKAVVPIDERYYPETLEHTFILNAPWVFSAFWKIVKPWLDPVTASKISVLGSDYKAELLKYIDADQLPEEYGGVCKCPEGCVRVYADEEIEAALAASDAKVDFSDVPIKAKGKHEIQFRIGKLGGYIHYHFSTKDNDIKFGITFKPDAKQDDLQVMLPMEKVKSHKSPIKGMIEFEEAGVATVTWDNSYSIWTDKQLRYHCDAEDTPAEDHDILEARKAHRHSMSHHS